MMYLKRDVGRFTGGVANSASGVDQLMALHSPTCGDLVSVSLEAASVVGYLVRRVAEWSNVGRSDYIKTV